MAAGGLDSGDRFDPGRWQEFDGVLFDLDGVLTDTASIHSRAWKTVFDRFLARRSEMANSDYIPFDIETDYRTHVDGRPRFEGVDQFLRSRSIELPWGARDDAPGESTVCAVGNSKNDLVGTILRDEGVEVYPGSLLLLRNLAARDKPMAVVTSSANAAGVLEAAGIANLFDVRVDGNVAVELGLRGKPHPDPFLEAARRLGVPPKKAVVIEDAISGVEAGRAGRFGLVIGVDRHGDAEALRRAGADVVVTDLAELV